MALRGREGTGVKGREAERKLVSLGSIPISSEAGALGGAQGCLLQPVRGVCGECAGTSRHCLLPGHSLLGRTTPGPMGSPQTWLLSRQCLESAQRSSDPVTFTCFHSSPGHTGSV